MLYLESCIEGTQKHILNESMDLAIADPPYNLRFGGTTQTKNKRPRFDVFPNDDLSPANYRRFTISWLREAYRVLKPGRHLYVCIDWRTYPDMVRWLKLVGFTVKNCIVWDKVNMGLGWQYRYQHEWIILATKGKNKVRRVSTRREADVWRIPRISGNKTIHPTEKPLELMTRLIKNSSNEGEHIIDFFSGSGVVYEEALRNKRHCEAFEIDPKWYQVSMDRINLVRHELHLNV